MLRVVDELLQDWQEDPVYGPVLERAQRALLQYNHHEWLLALSELPAQLRERVDACRLSIQAPILTARSAAAVVLRPEPSSMAR